MGCFQLYTSSNVQIERLTKQKPQRLTRVFLRIASYSFRMSKYLLFLFLSRFSCFSLAPSPSLSLSLSLSSSSLSLSLTLSLSLSLSLSLFPSATLQRHVKIARK